MTAKEMFEALGYELIKYDSIYAWFDYKSETSVITFFLGSKGYLKSDKENEDLVEMITPQEHKAITQQIKEMGWLND